MGHWKRNRKESRKAASCFEPHTSNIPKVDLLKKVEDNAGAIGCREKIPVEPYLTPPPSLCGTPWMCTL
jgi:hypothetical protein